MSGVSFGACRVSFHARLFPCGTCGTILASEVGIVQAGRTRVRSGRRRSLGSVSAMSRPLLRMLDPGRRRMLCRDAGRPPVFWLDWIGYLRPEHTSMCRFWLRMEILQHVIECQRIRNHLVGVCVLYYFGCIKNAISSFFHRTLSILRARVTDPSSSLQK